MALKLKPKLKKALKKVRPQIKPKTRRAARRVINNIDDYFKEEKRQAKKFKGGRPKIRL
jgi:hypothetical protein